MVYERRQTTSYDILNVEKIVLYIYFDPRSRRSGTRSRGFGAFSARPSKAYRKPSARPRSPYIETLTILPDAIGSAGPFSLQSRTHDAASTSRFSSSGCHVRRLPQMTKAAASSASSGSIDQPRAVGGRRSRGRQGHGAGGPCR